MIIPLPPRQIRRPVRDQRAAQLADAFSLSNGAAWLLGRIEAGQDELTRKDAAWMLLATLFTVRRSSRDLDQLADQIRDAIGGDGMFTSSTGWSLTPLGRLRIRRALGEEIRL